LGRIVERHRDHVHLLYDLPDGTTLTQKIIASSIFLVNKILVIEDYKLDNTFLLVTFESQSRLKSTSDQTNSDTNWRTGEGDQWEGGMGANQKFIDGTWPISQN
jgi:hypothetical protein